ncbi:hypothetical protein FKP32DRAFT_1267815 [Trametes sanguinea]|nr:hypothetical protein FKP32DRAFT_1267815 [Trametes sanguinea]
MQEHFPSSWCGGINWVRAASWMLPFSPDGCPRRTCRSAVPHCSRLRPPTQNGYSHRDTGLVCTKSSGVTFNCAAFKLRASGESGSELRVQASRTAATYRRAVLHGASSAASRGPEHSRRSMRASCRRQCLVCGAGLCARSLSRLSRRHDPTYRRESLDRSWRTTIVNSVGTRTTFAR